MAMKLYSDSDISDIADAIRSKNGSSDTYKVSQMASAIQAIPTGGITPTGTKSITANGTNIDVYNYQYADVAVPNSYSASDEGKVVSNGALVAQTSDTVTTNDTYDTTLINSLTVNVSGGGSGVQSATGTYTPTETYNTNGNRQITTIATIGFTPKRFILYITDRQDVYGTNGAMLYSFWNEFSATDFMLTTIRFSNTSGGIGTNNNTSNWTVSSNGYLYLNDGIVYMKTASNAQLIANVDYAWEAYSA